MVGSVPCTPKVGATRLATPRRICLIGGIRRKNRSGPMAPGKQLKAAILARRVAKGPRKKRRLVRNRQRRPTGARSNWQGPVSGRAPANREVDQQSRSRSASGHPHRLRDARAWSGLPSTADTMVQRREWPSCAIRVTCGNAAIRPELVHKQTYRRPCKMTRMTQLRHWAAQDFRSAKALFADSDAFRPGIPRSMPAGIPI